MESGVHLVGAVKFVLQFYKSHSFQIAYQLLDLLVVGLDIRIEVAHLFLEFYITGELFEDV